MLTRTRPRARSACGFDGPTSRSVEREMEREQRRLVEERLVGGDIWSGITRMDILMKHCQVEVQKEYF